MAGLNIIPDAKKKFSSLLKSLNYNSDNILQYYDNVTYNIRLYLISSSTQQIISKARESGQITNYQIPDKNKIIIADTTSSTKFSITSLTLHTVHANGCNSHSATTYGMDLTIKEVNGCQFVNQLEAITKFVGYEEGHIGQPYHLDVWFSGYNNETHKPYDIIPEVGVISYEVLLNEVKSNVDMSGTTYSCSMTNVGIGAVPKDTFALNDKGEWTSTKGTSLSSFRDKLADFLNKDYFEKHKYQNLEKYFPDNKYLYIRLIDLDRDDNIPNPLTEDYCSSTLQGVELLQDMSTDNNDSQSESGISQSKDESILTVFQNFALQTDELKAWLVRPTIKTQQVATVDGFQLNKIYIDVFFSRSRFLEQYNNRFDDISPKSNSKEDIEDAEYTAAYLHLVDILADQRIKKRYDWLWNGQETSLLEVTTSLDRLWYATLPFWDLEDSTTNNTNDYKSLVADANTWGLMNNDFQNMTKDEINRAISNAAYAADYYLNGVRSMSKNQNLYMEDIYACFDTAKRKELLDTRNVAEAVNGSDSKQTDSTNQVNQKVIIAKTGYNNIYGGGNLLELKIKILGDPDWIKLCSDQCYYENDYNSISKPQYFVFKMNTGLDQNLDGTYDMEGVTEFCNIYQIIESTSIFEDGRFIQELKAVIAPEFMILGRLEL